jgi:hypothetical protein
MKSSALIAAPSAGRAYESAGTARARMLTRVGLGCSVNDVGVIDVVLLKQKADLHVGMPRLNSG